MSIKEKQQQASIISFKKWTTCQRKICLVLNSKLNLETLVNMQ